MLITNNKRHSLDMNAAYHIIQYFSESSMKDLSSRFSQSFDLLLFQIFSEICQSHISLLQEGIVHGEGSTHALWLVALLGKFQILTKHRAVIWMGTVLDNLLGTAQWAFATEIGYSLFGNDHIHIVLGAVHVTAHRNNGRDATILGGTLRGEDRDVAIALVVAGTADTIHQLAAADVAGVLVAVDIALNGGVHGDDTQTADDLRRV